MCLLLCFTMGFACLELVAVSLLSCGAVEKIAAGLHCVVPFGHSLSSVVTLPSNARNYLPVVFFKCFKSHKITILAKESDSQDRGTTLKLCVLFTSPKSLVLPSKDNLIHIKS
ncbi:hypothetical protein DVH24_002165 [Malus domestica]|uniref:Secreted protein n=1 Tax=Malus domestica TaxID=3750 RepID=A0A498I9H9_MALDO|nr:hypothetical protein DVH24_002165 [Malus domestica]